MKSSEQRALKETIHSRREHIDALVETRAVRKKALLVLADLVQPKNIGWGEKQIRPGEHGRLDVYHALEGRVSRSERVVLAGLLAEDVAHETYRSNLRKVGVDPDNQKEVKEFFRVQQMSPAEVNRALEISAVDPELERLEKALAYLDPPAES